MSDTITIPGALDLHVHLREPGNNKAETIRSGTRAALRGGYVLVCDMPNNPGNPTWSAAKLDEKHKIIKESAAIPVATYAGAQPESDNLSELPAMAAGSIGLKLYGAPTTGNDRDYAAADFADIVKTWHRAAPKKPIMLHAGVSNLSDMINLVAKKYSHSLHICHVNDPGDVVIVARAKKQGLPVTCGVTPHHLFKTSHDQLSEGWFARMQPPLAEQAAATELLKLLADGSIDIVETDHAPHSLDAKWAAEAENPEGIHDPDYRTCFGVPGIEFALPLLFYQAKCGRLSMERIIDATSTKPAEIIGVALAGNTKVTWDMRPYRIGHEHAGGRSGSGWTPFLDKLAVGRVIKVTLSGRTIYHTGTIKKAGRVVASGDSL